MLGSMGAAGGAVWAVNGGADGIDGGEVVAVEM